MKIAPRKRIYSGHRDDVLCILCFRKLNRFVSCSHDGCVIIWGEKIKVECQENKDICISHIIKYDDTTFLSFSDDGFLRAYDVSSLKNIGEYKFDHRKKGFVRMTKTSEKRFFCLIMKNRNQKGELVEMSFSKSLSNEGSGSFKEVNAFEGFQIGSYSELVPSGYYKDCYYLNCCDDDDPKRKITDTIITLVDPSNSHPKAIFSEHCGKIYTMILSRSCENNNNGEYLLCGGDRGILFIYDAKKIKIFKKIDIEVDFCSLLLLREDDLLVGTGSGSFSIFSISKGKKILEEIIHEHDENKESCKIYDMKIADSDGTKILSCSKYDSRIILSEISYGGETL